MRPVVTDRVTWSVGLAGLSVTLVSPAKAAGPIEMPFGLWTWVGPENHVLDGSSQVMRDVAMATSFWTKIAMTGFVRTIATRQLAMEGAFEWSTDRMQILPVPCT